MIVLFTDFGPTGPYTGQVKAALYRDAPAVPVVELISDVPPFNARAAAYLLAALRGPFVKNTVFLCVVDPDVGATSRRPIAVKADEQWFVGPDNGLFSIVARRAKALACWEIMWRPHRLSNTFHGRDLFAPVAAILARGQPVPGGEIACADVSAVDWPEDLYEVIYIDHFGNAVTGVRASMLKQTVRLRVGRHELGWARTFSEVAEGAGFWYENANGLVEIAVNRGNAARSLDLKVGNTLQLTDGSVRTD